jgi:acetyl esterase/lipase
MIVITFFFINSEIVSAEDIPATYGVKVTTDVKYGEAINNSGKKINLLLDVYQPVGDATTIKPAIILIHGGGFEGGDKAQDLFIRMATEFAQQGYVAYSINYRLSSYVGYEGAKIVRDKAVSDAITALEWIRRNGATYGIAINKIAVAGDSAGGAIVTNLSYKDGASANIAVCINMWGGMPNEKGSTIKEPWGGNLFEDEIPINAPATLLIHGTADSCAPYINSTKLAERLEKANIKYELFPLQGAEHYPEDRVSEFIPEMLKFTDDVMNGITALPAPTLDPAQPTPTSTPYPVRSTATPKPVKSTPTPSPVKSTPNSSSTHPTTTPGYVQQTPTPSPVHPTPSSIRPTTIPGSVKTTPSSSSIQPTPTPGTTEHTAKPTDENIINGELPKNTVNNPDYGDNGRVKFLAALAAVCGFILLVIRKIILVFKKRK